MVKYQTTVTSSSSTWSGAVNTAALLAVTAVRLTAAEPAVRVADFERVLAGYESFILPTRDGFLYEGMLWNGVYIINALHPLTEQMTESGYRKGLVSGTYAAVVANRGVPFSEIRADEDRRFDLYSLHVAAVWRDELAVRLEGRRGDEIVEERLLHLNVSEPQLVEAAFLDIDSLRIIAGGGRDAGVCRSTLCSEGPEVVIDDVRFSIRPDEVSEGPPLSEPELEPSPAADEPEPEPAAAPPPAPEPAAAAASGCKSAGYYGVQVGAFRSRANALNLARRLRNSHGNAQIHWKQYDSGPVHFVIAGCFDDKSDAKALADELAKRGQEGLPVRATKSRVGERMDVQ